MNPVTWPPRTPANVRPVVAALLLLTLAACAPGSDEADGRLPPPKPKTVTVTVAPTSDGTPSPENAQTPGPGVVDTGPGDGLYCRDLKAQGYTYSESVAYWIAQGRPPRMDADGNGIPCETVYESSDVEQYFGTMADTEPVQAPRGTLHILGPLHGPYGQGFSMYRECTSWTLRFVNDSDTAIHSAEFRFNEAGYSGTSSDTHEWVTQPASPPAPQEVVLSLGPGNARDVTFQTCTTTPAPTDPNLHFGASTPREIPFTWVTGAIGSTRIE